MKNDKETEPKTLEEQICKDLGLPLDYIPKDEYEAYRIVTTWLED